MFNLFKSRPADVKGIRHAVVQFVKEQLQRAEGGEGQHIKGLHLFVFCAEADRHLYHSALYTNDPDRFKTEEIQRIADDYALELPAGWTFDIVFEEPAAGAVRCPDADVALLIETPGRVAVRAPAEAWLRTLSGTTQKEVYHLRYGNKHINIGRGSRAQMPNGFFRENGIAFDAEGDDVANRSVSRQHAHLQWDAQSGALCLYADEGGIPPANKTKVLRTDGSIIKIQSMEFGVRLQAGDQLMLGESAVLEFLIQPPEIA